MKRIVRQIMDDMKNSRGSVNELPKARIIQESSDSPRDHGDDNNMVPFDVNTIPPCNNDRMLYVQFIHMTLI